MLRTFLCNVTLFVCSLSYADLLMSLYSGGHEVSLRSASGTPQVPNFRGAVGYLNLT